MAKSVAADLLTGFAALGLIMAGFITGTPGQNLRTQVIVVGVLFLFAGIFRGASAVPSASWMKGLFIDLGASIPVLLMAWSGAAFTSKPHLVFFLSTSLVAAVAGVYARRLGRWAGPGVGIGSMVATLLVAGLLVPVVLERLSFRHLNRPAPAFSFKSPDGSRITNESLRGRVAVLTFWATWCPPCREELPRINALFARYRQAPDVAFLAVNTEAEAPIRNAENFLQKRGLSVPLVVAEDESARNLGAAALPTLVILDRAGNIRLIHVGYDGAENLDGVVSKQINALLRPER